MHDSPRLAKRAWGPGRFTRKAFLKCQRSSEEPWGIKRRFSRLWDVLGFLVVTEAVKNAYKDKAAKLKEEYV